MIGATLAATKGLLERARGDAPTHQAVQFESGPGEPRSDQLVPASDATASGSPFRAVADATVQAANPNVNDGGSNSLRSAVWPEVRSYIRFEVAGVSGNVRKATVTTRALRSSHSGFEIYLAEGSWQEGAVTFANAPRLTRVLDSSGPVKSGSSTTLDVTPVVDGPGTYTFAIVTSAARSVALASRESGYPPVLSIATGTWCKGVVLDPGDSIQAAIDHHGEGTTFCLRAGVHRLAERLFPKNRQRFIGQDGAILNGSKRLTSFRREGSFWIADGQTQELGGGTGECQKSGYTGCTLPERVFMDGQSRWEVTSLSELSSGEFYFDHDANQIYLADDPEGHVVETTMATAMFADWAARGVVVRNLIVEKFGTPAQGSSLGGQSANGWVIVGNEVRNNSGIGICGGAGALVKANFVHDQGQLGLCGQHAGGTYANNTVSHNNVDGFLVYWEAGGSKWVATTGLTVVGNYFHDNIGTALWTDGGNYKTRYLNNRVEHNQGLGILHEISYDAVIRDNYVADNGALTQAELDGAGIMVASSSNVDVVNNTVVDNADGIVFKQHSTESGDRGPFLVENAFVHNNVILMCEGETGGIQTVGDDAIFTSRNNRFDRNTYLLNPSRPESWRWMDDFRTKAQWMKFDQDLHSRFSTTSC